jgi:hypothetical protein
MLDEMVAACETLVAHTVAACYCARELRSAHAVNGGLVALQVG